jgi:hypothetical protein
MNIDEIAVALAKSFPWIKDGTSIIVLLMALGRLVKSLQERNGLVGFVRSLLYGSSYNPGCKPEDKPQEKKPE